MDEDRSGATPWPLEIHYTAATRSLVIAYDNGVTFTYPAELLRVESPSAEVKGHGADEKRIVAGRSHVGIMKIEPVGNYAVRLHFDDLHDTGLYSWRYLYDLGDRQDEIWQTYLAELDARGLSREP